MSKTRKYYAIYVMYANNLAYQNLFTVSAKLVENNKIRLEVAHEEAFKTKKAALEALKKLPHPALYIILDIYLNLGE